MPMPFMPFWLGDGTGVGKKRHKSLACGSA
jgi:hypothetical protein